jgi:acyl-CoA reductase-like NAD-dependent aldehyde dehydrogenase
MKDRVRLLKVGDILADGSKRFKTDLERTDVGAMVSDRFFDRIEKLIEDAVAKGARLIHGGKRMIHSQFPDGHYFEPTLIVDVTKDMDIAQQELFAPVMTVMKYDKVNEAIEIANGTRYGLGASVFGKNLDECRLVAGQVKSGMVCTNGV